MLQDRGAPIRIFGANYTNLNQSIKYKFKFKSNNLITNKVLIYSLYIAVKKEIF